jgi:hypothetical protein
MDIPGLAKRIKILNELPSPLIKSKFRFKPAGRRRVQKSAMI